MNKTRTLTAAALLGLLAVGDWFLMDTPADPEGLKKPGLTIGKVTVTGSMKDNHAFLELKGDGKGTVTIRLTETEILVARRMMPRPKTLWDRSIALDTSKARSIDLGALPKSKGMVHHQLLASIDGKTFIPLANHSSLVKQENHKLVNLK